MAVKIPSTAGRTLNSGSGMPQMMAAFAGWTKQITLKIITQTVVDALVIQDSSSVTFEGTIQPLKAQEIALKPEGQRAWQWLQIHCINSKLNLKVNDLIEYGGETFKIMALKDYSLNNYIEYHATKDFARA